MVNVNTEKGSSQNILQMDTEQEEWTPTSRLGSNFVTPFSDCSDDDENKITEPVPCIKVVHDYNPNHHTPGSNAIDTNLAVKYSTHGYDRNDQDEREMELMYSYKLLDAYLANNDEEFNRLGEEVNLFLLKTGEIDSQSLIDRNSEAIRNNDQRNSTTDSENNSDTGDAILFSEKKIDFKQTYDCEEDVENVFTEADEAASETKTKTMPTVDQNTEIVPQYSKDAEQRLREIEKDNRKEVQVWKANKADEAALFPSERKTKTMPTVYSNTEVVRQYSKEAEQRLREIERENRKKVQVWKANKADEAALFPSERKRKTMPAVYSNTEIAKKYSKEVEQRLREIERENRKKVQVWKANKADEAVLFPSERKTKTMPTVYSNTEIVKKYSKEAEQRLREIERENRKKVHFWKANKADEAAFFPSERKKTLVPTFDPNTEIGQYSKEYTEKWFRKIQTEGRQQLHCWNPNYDAVSGIATTSKQSKFCNVLA
jgi:hypothetical protein